MSANKSNDIAADTARVRSILSKKQPTRLQGSTKVDLQLRPGDAQRLGQHAVIAIATAEGSWQFTVSRPIGITDLAEDDWVINSTESMTQLLANREDPSQGAINQERARVRTQLAVKAGLLEIREVDGRNEVFYPMGVVPRNRILKDAEDALKDRKKELESLRDTATGKGQKVLYSNQLAQTRDVAKFLGASDREAEVELRKFYQKPEVVLMVEELVPQNYRTLGGEFNNTPQTAIAGARGLPLGQVMGSIAKMISAIEIQPDQGPEMVAGPDPAAIEAAFNRLGAASAPPGNTGEGGKKKEDDPPSGGAVDPAPQMPQGALGALQTALKGGGKGGKTDDVVNLIVEIHSDPGRIPTRDQLSTFQSVADRWPDATERQNLKKAVAELNRRFANS